MPVIQHGDHNREPRQPASVRGSIALTPGQPDNLVQSDKPSISFRCAHALLAPATELPNRRRLRASVPANPYIRV
jgi:hypothetical protein